MKNFLFPLLLVLSILYIVVTKVKFFLYSSKILRRKKLPVKVICVGNISSGGTGKTTAVIYLSKMLLEKGYRVAVLSRGYKREKREERREKVVCVSDGKEILVDVKIAGDEPYMIAKNLQNTSVVVSSDRYSAGKVAIEKFQSEILLLDDGFQHWQLHRDIDTVLVDCLNTFGQLLPLGLQREPLSALNRANIILLTNTNFASEEKLSNIIQTIRKYNKTSPIFKSIHKPLYLQTIHFASHLPHPDLRPRGERKHSHQDSQEKIDISFVAGKDIIALSGIGSAKSFELTLKSSGANIVKKLCYSDHHWYTIDEIKKILNENILTITTEKDAVRLENVILSEAKDLPLDNLLFLKIQLEILEDKELLEETIRELNQ